MIIEFLIIWKTVPYVTNPYCLTIIAMSGINMTRIISAVYISLPYWLSGYEVGLF